MTGSRPEGNRGASALALEPPHHIPLTLPAGKCPSSVTNTLVHPPPRRKVELTFRGQPTVNEPPPVGTAVTKSTGSMVNVSDEVGYQKRPERAGVTTRQAGRPLRGFPALEIVKDRVSSMPLSTGPRLTVSDSLSSHLRPERTALAPQERPLMGPSTLETSLSYGSVAPTSAGPTGNVSGYSADVGSQRRLERTGSPSRHMGWPKTAIPAMETILLSGTAAYKSAGPRVNIAAYSPSALAAPRVPGIPVYGVYWPWGYHLLE